MGLQLRSLQTCSRNGGGRCKAQRYIACKAALPASYRPFLGPDPNRIDGEGFYQCGPVTPRPSYEAIDANAFNKWAMGFYLSALLKALGETHSELDGFDAVTDISRRITDKYAHAEEAQEAGLAVCRAIFPHWIPPIFTMLVSWPFASRSAQINAWGVGLTCQWLLGETEVVDVEVDGGKIGKGQGLYIKRCRYLEESGCASVCINICKIPTQEYFRERLGVSLTMAPNYDDFSCLATFGKTPPTPERDPVFQAPCFSTCTSRRRSAHKTSACHLVYQEPKVLPPGASVRNPVSPKGRLGTAADENGGMYVRY